MRYLLLFTYRLVFYIANIECTEECHSNASCHFTPLGGQVCRCNNDYYGNGKRCFRKDDNYHRRKYKITAILEFFRLL